MSESGEPVTFRAMLMVVTLSLILAIVAPLAYVASVFSGGLKDVFGGSR